MTIKNEEVMRYASERGLSLGEARNVLTAQRGTQTSDGPPVAAPVGTSELVLAQRALVFNGVPRAEANEVLLTADIHKFDNLIEEQRDREQRAADDAVQTAWAMTPAGKRHFVESKRLERDQLVADAALGADYLAAHGVPTDGMSLEEVVEASGVLRDDSAELDTYEANLAKVRQMDKELGYAEGEGA